MPDGSALLLFLGATLALNLTPGPDMLYVVARSVGEGRAAGIASALGIAAGCLVHMLRVAFGLAQLLLAVPAAYDAVRFAGAAYLVYLGIRALRSRPAAEGAPAPARASRGAIFRQGMVTNILNPKVARFFLAFLPQFVDPERGSVAAQILLLGLLFNLSGTLVNLAVAWAASGARRWTVRAGGAPVFQRLTGLVFIALGIRIALTARR